MSHLIICPFYRDLVGASQRDRPQNQPSNSTFGVRSYTATALSVRSYCTINVFVPPPLNPGGGSGTKRT